MRTNRYTELGPGEEAEKVVTALKRRIADVSLFREALQWNRPDLIDLLASHPRFQAGIWAVSDENVAYAYRVSSPGALVLRWIDENKAILPGGGIYTYCGICLGEQLIREAQTCSPLPPDIALLLPDQWYLVLGELHERLRITWGVIAVPLDPSNPISIEPAPLLRQ